jgi:SM-20-related protein
MYLNLEALRAATVTPSPYPHFAVPALLAPEQVARVIADYPQIDMAGIFPVESLAGGPAFKALVEELRGPEVKAVIAEKFGMSLDNHKTMLTVRACCRATDGKIHADATFKKATLLLYLNDQDWPHPGGRLRVLRSPTDIDDYSEELPPLGGSLFAFKCVDNAWHGHTSYQGVRRYLMLNYVEDMVMLKRELARHRFSAGVKKLKRAVGLGKFAQA